MKLYRFESISSTQEKAFQLLEKEDKVVVWALEQTQGKGRAGHRWISRRGGLYISFGFKGSFLHALAFNLSLTLCVLDLLRKRGIDAHLKVPNDILVGRRKIAGILVEIKGNNVVIGLGLNVNQEDVGETGATSMILETGEEYVLDEIVLELTDCLTEKLDPDIDKLRKLYEKEIVGRRIAFTYDNERIEGTIQALEGWHLIVDGKGYHMFHIYDVEEL